MMVALDAFLVEAQASEDFTEKELECVRRVREVCLEDMDIVHEARLRLAESKQRLARKETQLSALMEKLSPEDLESPMIRKMIDYFVQSHIQLDNRIRRIESVLGDMYPAWTDMVHPSQELDQEEAEVSEVSEVVAVSEVEGPEVSEVSEEDLDSSEESLDPDPVNHLGRFGADLIEELGAELTAGFGN